MQLRLLCAVLFGAFLPFSSVWAVSVNQLVVFGDSLSDNGNANFLTAGLFPGPNYDGSRFTDGANTTPSTAGPFGIWIEQLAPKLGVLVPTPGFIPGGGTNFAVASADTGSNSLFYISDQVALYLATAGGTASPTSLYTFWAGANDITDAKNPVTAANNIFNNILALSQTGAKYFLWANLPPLGQTPLGLASGQSAALNAQSDAFNAQWSADIATLQSQGIQVFPLDVATLFAQISADPAASGFTNITDPAQGKTGIDPNTYLFWDDRHPTTAADALLANLAYNELVGTTVPEPATGVIVLIGAAILGTVRFGRRQA
jgi:phospholipase/lecithinase/hemolysin